MVKFRQKSAKKSDLKKTHKNPPNCPYNCQNDAKMAKNQQNPKNPKKPPNCPPNCENQ